jgi:hypothetical protein
MNEAQALEVFRQLIDQATGLGLFKTADQVNVAQAALQVLKDGRIKQVVPTDPKGKLE